jgi:cellobiose-specific phosphotransferase system component IIC
MVLTIPVIIEYIWEKFIYKSMDAKMYTLLPSSIGNVFHTDISWMLPFFITIVVVSLVFYMVCLERKCDCGEE